MEAHVHRVEKFVGAPAQHVLAGVLLHDIEAPFLVDMPRDGLAHGQRPLRTEDQLVPAFPHVDDLHAAQDARVAGLAPLVGEEDGPVHHHVEPLLGGLAGEDGALVFEEMAFSNRWLSTRYRRSVIQASETDLHQYTTPFAEKKVDFWGKFDILLP